MQWQKTSQKFPSDFPFIVYLLNLNYEKSAKFNSTFLRHKSFSILPKYWQVGKYTALLSEFSSPRKAKKISLSFGWWIYVMVEQRNLWCYGKLFIWKSELVFPSDKWNYSELTQSITVKLVQTTTSLRLTILSSPKQILVQSLLYKTTTCLTRPATTFFCLPNENMPSKTTTKKFYATKKCETNIRNNA